MKTEKKIKILMAMPMGVHAIEPSALDCFANVHKPDNVVVVYKYLIGYGITDARHAAAKLAIEAKADYVLFVDSDVLISPQTLEKLLALDADIACGFYVRKHEPELTEIRVLALDGIQMKKIALDEIASVIKPTEIAACGFGCALVKTHVFDKIKVDGAYFRWVQTSTKFCTEDLDFCRRAVEAGCKIILEPSLLCGHIAKVILPQKK